MKDLFRLISVITFFCLLGLPSKAYSICEVELSFIKGSTESEQIEKLDTEILGQLKNLPFSSFSLLAKEKKETEYNQIVEFNLSQEGGKNKVAITPIKTEGKKNQALIEWTGSNGENLLSSKMWLNNKSNMVLGTEHGSTNCTVINISIGCD